MNEHYVIVADHGHVRIFSRRKEPEQMAASLTEVQALDFPHGKQSYAEGDTDFAGRFQGSKHQSRGPGSPVARTGMSIDERLPMQREEERKRIHDVSQAIESFLKGNPQATWDFAAPAEIQRSIVNALTPDVVKRLGISVGKDLVHQPVSQLLSHFAAS